MSTTNFFCFIKLTGQGSNAAISPSFASFASRQGVERANNKDTIPRPVPINLPYWTSTLCEVLDEMDALCGDAAGNKDDFVVAAEMPP